MESTIIDWDGEKLPEELKRLSPGRYVIEPMLSVEEETGLMSALDQLDAGRGLSLADVIREIKNPSRRS